MKKLKLLTSLGIVSTLSCTAAVSITACTDDTDIKITTDMPSTITDMIAKAYTLDVTYSGKKVDLDKAIVNVSSANDDILTATWDKREQKMIITPVSTRGSTVVDIVITDTNNKTGRVILPVDIEVYNKFVYDGKSYEMADNVDPSKFITKNSNNAYISQEIPVIIGGSETTITIGGNQDKWNLLTSLAFSSTTSVETTIEDNFLRGCYNLTSVDLSGLSNINSIGQYFLSASLSLDHLDLSPLTNIDDNGIDIRYFVYNAETLKWIDFGEIKASCLDNSKGNLYTLSVFDDEATPSTFTNGVKLYGTYNDEILEVLPKRDGAEEENYDTYRNLIPVIN